MKFSETDIQEFKTEALELFESAEKSLLELESGAEFRDHYQAIFRAFHSVKGAAGIMELNALQSHLHQVETLLTGMQERTELSKGAVSFFLRAIDAARAVLNDKEISFVYSVDDDLSNSKEPELSLHSTTAMEPPSEPILQLPPESESSGSVISHLPPEIKEVEGQSEARVELLNSNPKENIVKRFSTPGRALILGQDFSTMENLSHGLNLAGFETHCLIKKEDLIPWISSYKADLVIVDFDMSHSENAEFINQIKQSSPELPLLFILNEPENAILLEIAQQDYTWGYRRPADPAKVISTCFRAYNHIQTKRMLESAIEVSLAQFAELDKYHFNANAEISRKLVRQRLGELLLEKRVLNEDFEYGSSN